MASAAEADGAMAGPPRCATMTPPCGAGKIPVMRELPRCRAAAASADRRRIGPDPFARCPMAVPWLRKRLSARAIPSDPAARAAVDLERVAKRRTLWFYPKNKMRRPGFC
jgi:hypothetical protein